MTDRLLTATEAAKVLELPRSTFYRYRSALRGCLAVRPVGQRKYVLSRLEQFKSGQSTVSFVRRSA